MNTSDQLSSTNTSTTVHKAPTDQPSSPSLPSKELSPPPLPPKDPVSSSTTVPVPSLPIHKNGSVSKQKDRMEAVMPEELPPQLFAKKAVKAADTADRINGKSNLYERPPILSSLRVTGSPPNKGKKSLHDNTKKQPLSIPPWQAVVNLPCNDKDDNISLPVLPEKQALYPPFPSSRCGDNSDKRNQKSVRGCCTMTDRYVSIHNDHKSGRINIFVSKPECIMESSDSSEEEDECNDEEKFIPQPSLKDDTLVLSRNTSSMPHSVNGKEYSLLPGSIKNLPTAQRPPHGLPRLKFKHQTSPFPLDAPLSAPPVGIEGALPTSVVKCASSNGISVLSSGITSAYSQLELSPKEMKQQVLMIVLLYR